MKGFSSLKHEIKEVGLVFLYFFFCFGVVLTLKKLLLADYQIEVQALSTAAIAALIVAKVVLVLDKTKAGTRFDSSHPLGLAALYKTTIYALATFVALFLEQLFHAFRETGILENAVMEVWTHRDRNIMLAKVLCIGLAFLTFHLYTGLDRLLGEGTIRHLILHRPGTPRHRKTAVEPET